ncbi:MAG: hypothetical protein AAF846_05620 [Chloroflexota bacterium]
MEINAQPYANVQLVRYKSPTPSERFIIITGNEISRALVSWNQDNKLDSEEFLAVFISNPNLARLLSTTLSQKITNSQV